MSPFSLYIHIPFCFHKCPYCDFNTYAVSTIPERDYVGGLLAELDARAAHSDFSGRELQTIFFGGGTPSLFTPNGIGEVINAARSLFATAAECEISLEANPGTVTEESLMGYRSVGVNRLSFGAQSFSPAILRTLGRMHSPEQISHSVEFATQAGFNNVSIDLIFGVPSQTVADLGEDLAAALSLPINHLSAYSLTIENGTPFYSAWKRGALVLPPEETTVQMLELLDRELTRSGFLRYEISNWAMPGKKARHNLAYWDGDDYLGLGAGAHSKCGGRNIWGRRWANIASPKGYIEQATTAGSAEAWSEELTQSSAVFEFFFLGLRKTEGISRQAFRSRFGIEVESCYGDELHELISGGFLVDDGERLALSSHGLLLADSVVERFAQPRVP